MIKVYITKYALTEGIIEREAEVCTAVNPDMIQVELPVTSGFAHTQHFHKGDWFSTREEAVSKALDMRARKIKSLHKQISKLEGMRFD